MISGSEILRRIGFSSKRQRDFGPLIDKIILDELKKEEFEKTKKITKKKNIAEVIDEFKEVDIQEVVK